jgi:hypothetical protein
MYPYKFIFNPKDNENAEAFLESPNSRKSIIHGIVKEKNHEPIKSAVVRISEESEDKENHLAYIITDEEGEFVYGPIDDESRIIIKVWVEKAKVREVVISPNN